MLSVRVKVHPSLRVSELIESIKLYLAFRFVILQVIVIVNNVGFASPVAPWLLLYMMVWLIVLLIVQIIEIALIIWLSYLYN